MAPKRERWKRGPPHTVAAPEWCAESAEQTRNPKSPTAKAKERKRRRRPQTGADGSKRRVLVTKRALLDPASLFKCLIVLRVV